MAIGRARLAMAQGTSVWVLEAPDGFGDAGFHAHHAIQLTFSLSGTLSLTGEAGVVAAPAIAVAADASHRLEAHGLLALVFVEPESRAGRTLHGKLFSRADLVALDCEALMPMLVPLQSTFASELGAEHLHFTGQAVVDALVPTGPAALPDARILRVVERATAHLDESLDRAAAAAGVHLSPSRLRHLFVEQTGLAYKTYLLWLRLVRALQVYADGKSLTEAAHAAGFADSAHFSRTFRRTFGLPATTLERL